MTSDTISQEPSSVYPDHDQYLSVRYFGSLNGLRFFCIFAVLWHHAPIWTQLSDPQRILTRGFLGVDFFFVLSGFLITTLLLREEDRSGRFSLKGFYWRRILRIVPVYFLVVTAISIYYIGIKGMGELLELVPFYYLFLSNFLVEDIPMLAPTWSLSVEEQYYLIWPMLLLLVPRRSILPLLVVLIFLNLVAVTGGLRLIGIQPIESYPLLFKMFTATYAPILIGSGLAVLLHKRESFRRFAQLFGSKWSSPILFTTLLILIQMLPADMTGWPNLILHLAMASCLASIVIREDHQLRCVFEWSPFIRVGEISYGVYLYHLIGLHIATLILAKLGTDEGWIIFLVYSAISICIAELSFRLYETRFFKLRYKTQR
ncbi:acyltransferase family protein [Falsiruegeria litorea]|uniref:acyltransferase family protein n=1 Tax=Falsiruegeria litorea TaxID=1280831 RepID=UPI001BFEA406|nr:acyltransferase [Falsiruegeria litorea]